MSVICVPGQRLLKLGDENVAGAGTYVKNGYVYSSLAGHLNTDLNNEGKTIVTVSTKAILNVVPNQGSLVTARVTNVNPRFCKCAILAVDNVNLTETFRGMIRREDVRATEKDKIEMYKSFRPGDIILARVLSLGDAQSYVLATTENELGVVLATSEAGVTMIPISWCEMQCPKTLTKELRKVAKVQAHHIQIPKR